MDLTTAMPADGSVEPALQMGHDGAAPEPPIKDSAAHIEQRVLLAMINIVPDYLFVKDRNSRFILSNRVVAADLGLDVEDLLGRTDFDLHPEELAEKYFADEQRIMGSGKPEIDIEEFILTAEGRKKWLLTSKLPFHNANGQIVGIVGVCRDITTRKEAEAALAESESRWDSALEAAGQGFWDHNIRRGTAFFSRTWRQMRGFGLNEEIDPSREAWLARVHPDDRARLTVDTDRQVSGEIGHTAYEYRERHRDGHYIWILSRGNPTEWNDDGSIARIVGTDTDITKMKEEEARTAHAAAETYRRHLDALEKAHEETEAAHKLAESMARHDALTGLPNRRVFSENLEAAIARASRGNSEFAVLLLDLDRFKPINDLHGHAVGDAVLIEVASRLSGLVRKTDTAARLGGDEFAVILDNAGQKNLAADAVAVAERLIATLSRPIEVDGQSLSVGASIGIATCPTDGADPETLLQAADMAMYRAKQEGRSGLSVFQFYQPTMERALKERIALEEDVRRAVLENQIVPHYQPLMRLAEDQLAGFEVLARWRHPERGDVGPDVFIPIVEKLGLIGEFTYSLLRRACHAALEWPQPLPFSINISPVHLNDPLLPSKLLTVLSETGLSPNRLEIEITETALMTNMARARSTLAALQECGIKVALDDFGVGYSSLCKLRELQFDKIKIDRSFVLTMLSNSGSAKIVRSVIELAKSLGMPTIAEGIESQDIMKQITQDGGEYGQGYYFGKAMPAEQALELVKKRYAEPLCVQADL